MRAISETASTDLSGGTLFPEYGNFDTIRSSSDYLVSSLSLGMMTESYLQVDNGSGEDVDTFVMRLDAGDTYQILFSTSETEEFLRNRGMTVFGTHGDYVGLILNDYGNTFSAAGTLRSSTFTAAQSGDYLLFASFNNWSGPVIAEYGLTLEKVRDITPWNVSLNRNGFDAKAVIASGDETIRAGTQITISLSFATSNMTFDDVKMLVSGSISTSMSSNNGSTTIYITMAASQTVTMQNLVEVSFKGAGASKAGSLEVTSVSVLVAGSSTHADVGTPIFISAENMILAGTLGNDLLIGGDGHDRLSGLAGNDTLNGGAGNDTLNGGTGLDRMAGSVGNDTYVIDNAKDTVIEAANQGTDLVQSSINYTLSTNVENLSLLGTAALSGTGNALSNLINGNVGNNILNGLAGNDTLNGGAGNDTLNGGAGNDLLFGDSGNDLLEGGEGNNTINAGVGHDTVRTGAGSDTINAGVGNDSVTSGAGGDRVFGLGGNDTIDSGAGHDIIIGGDGNDLLRGGEGNDDLAAEAGNDTLDGGAGNDMLRGGPSADLFIFNNGNDTIRSFDSSQDRVDLSSFGGVDSFGDVQARLSQSGGHVYFQAGSHSLKIEWTSVSSLVSDDFIW